MTNLAEFEPYLSLLSKFKQNEISIGEFESEYLTAFKNDLRDFSEEAFDVLNDMFTELDAYDAEELRIIGGIDEKAVREKATLCVDRISEISSAKTR